MFEKDQIIWRIKYVNKGEEKLRAIEIHTDSEELDDLFDELEQFEDARILSIRNLTLESERNKKK